MRISASERTRIWQANNPDKVWSNQLQFKFGINLEEYNKIFQAQSGRCAICHKHQTEFKKRLCVEHCHDTNKVRGLLCFDCNTGLGKLGDNLEGLSKAIKYLENSIG